MKSILEELWYGNVYPNTECRESTKEAKELMGYIADSRQPTSNTHGQAKRDT